MPRVMLLHLRKASGTNARTTFAGKKLAVSIALLAHTNHKLIELGGLSCSWTRTLECVQVQHIAQLTTQPKLASPPCAPVATSHPAHRTIINTRIHISTPKLATTTQDYLNSATGNPSTPSHNAANVHLVVRKFEILLLHKNTKTKFLEHLPLLSPHTRVCGMRKVSNKPNSTLYKKNKNTQNPP